ncbi:17037_t:CDS:1 [Acaulospora morrowiae]|uniref:17037_t:CDS:1 n=1 Tax=Acaulospora morrowiae TaxID=94023 RepID=A0A9N9G8H9_9GLOM|nr:17037_t:CDS:1 [Acaulospora morrowiae]
MHLKRRFMRNTIEEKVRTSVFKDSLLMHFEQFLFNSHEEYSLGKQVLHSSSLQRLQKMISKHSNPSKVTIILLISLLSTSYTARSNPLYERNIPVGYQPMLWFQQNNENMANTESANNNQFGLQSSKGAESASNIDNEASSNFLITKRDSGNRYDIDRFTRRNLPSNGHMPTLFSQQNNENIANTESANNNQFGLQSSKGAESASSLDNEASSNFLITKRDSRNRYNIDRFARRNLPSNGHMPTLISQQNNENIANTESANNNKFGLQSSKGTESACSLDNEASSNFLIAKRVGQNLPSNGHMPTLFSQKNNENIANTESANNNQFGLQSSKGAESASSLDNEASSNFFITKRDSGNRYDFDRFVRRNLPSNGHMPTLLSQQNNENIANTESANNKQFGLQSSKGTESASSLDNEASSNFLIAKRDKENRYDIEHLERRNPPPNGYRRTLYFQQANENVGSTEAANVNSLNIQSNNAAESAGTFVNEGASTFVMG